MKKTLPIIIIGIMLLSVIGATATTTNHVKSTYDASNIDYNPSGPTLAYTHTVLVEVGTATWCPSCPASNSAWHNIYAGGNYDFEYCEMVIDKNTQANIHMNARNLYWVPTSYFDGGEFVEPGTSTSAFYSHLDASGSRLVPDLEATMTVDWIGHSQLDISVDVTNNEVVDYPGTLRVYIVELESTHYDDYSGNPYYHAFLDFAINDPINIAAGVTYSDSVVWDKNTNGFPGLLVDNVQVILAVFDDTPHTAYSDPPSGAPFNAYYVDETIAVIPTYENVAPDDPHVEGTVNGKAGVEYTYSFCTDDPDGDDIYYWIEWGDSCPAVEWIGPFPSGVCMTLSHNWTDQGDYTIQAKAKDSYDAESGWGYLDISMPLNHQAPSWFFQLLQKYPRIFPILRTLIGV
jgi:hypothetical protein